MKETNCTGLKPSRVHTEPNCKGPTKRHSAASNGGWSKREYSEVESHYKIMTKRLYPPLLRCFISKDNKEMKEERPDFDKSSSLWMEL